MLFSKKKAFTLTELLVVVIVLGTLAAIAVPKFSRVLETRKTTEAENIFSAVRDEQEHRCSFGKRYQTDKSQVQMLADLSSSNYAYGLTEQGITASSGKGYTLKMLSYKDGQVCCEGDYCDSLNKDYPKCDTITVAKDECAGEAVVVEPQPQPDPEPTPMECSASTKPSTSQACGNCGTQVRTVTCNSETGEWVAGAWGSCSGQGVCSPGETESQSCGGNYVGRQQRTCSSSCTWSAWDSSNCAEDVCTAYPNMIMTDTNTWSYCCKNSSVTNPVCYKSCSKTTSSLGSLGSTQYGWISTGKTCSNGGGGQAATHISCTGMTCGANTVGMTCCSGSTERQCGIGTSGSTINKVTTEWYCATSVQCSENCLGYTKASSGSNDNDNDSGGFNPGAGSGGGGGVRPPGGGINIGGGNSGGGGINRPGRGGSSGGGGISIFPGR